MSAHTDGHSTEIVSGSGGNCQSSVEKKESKPNINVCSANNWESADLGDEDRKQKFLRLMGGGKEKPHKGKIVIGEKQKPMHVHNTDTEHLSKDLEEQYTQSMEHRQIGGKRGHIGLGFHEQKTENDQEKPVDEKRDSEKDNSSDSLDKNDDSSREKESHEVDEPSPKKARLSVP